MTSAERSRRYREKLKLRGDYDLIKQQNAKRNQLYRISKQGKLTDEEIAEQRAKTRERVKKHRELKKAKGESVQPPNQEAAKVGNRDRKEKKEACGPPRNGADIERIAGTATTARKEQLLHLLVLVMSRQDQVDLRGLRKANRGLLKGYWTTSQMTMLEEI
ncbi:hypothetical protein PoB_007379500 [Plakobranchus ocellatus]|uniref:Uncharacterized protein n=1 Tax=Plakobranchus ocellatus TaxID=259542 RepID=A0AAV4DT16_9GAST|nr:hypothetical protein PoB_007379500 [Plakobranchus ocellatus]